jgi:hypothetical protein
VLPIAAVRNKAIRPCSSSFTANPGHSSPAQPVGVCSRDSALHMSALRFLKSSLMTPKAHMIGSMALPSKVNCEMQGSAA